MTVPSSLMTLTPCIEQRKKESMDQSGECGKLKSCRLWPARGSVFVISAQSADVNMSLHWLMVWARVSSVVSWSLVNCGRRAALCLSADVNSTRDETPQRRHSTWCTVQHTDIRLEYPWYSISTCSICSNNQKRTITSYSGDEYNNCRFLFVNVCMTTAATKRLDRF